ncbi:ParB/RepB/Spo0J family partition protein [Castellaniella sp.]|uniref:ParB/RepB/Spo0J family partition protein n=1 Tax=Castellaniella sp. TaxID=1955812 RepID=UPI002AFE3B7A|nr:ParB/RepB/Spo0J family partition protein [Castellaniella sp.]
MATRKKGLGRGLDALLGDDRGALDAVGAGHAPAAPSQLPVAVLRAGRYQPRTRMDEEALNDLADSIRAQGIMQPILVRPLEQEPGQYEIIAGERRYRAAQIVGLTDVPVLVRQVADEHAAAMALIENIQREDLNPLEEAQGVRRLLDEFGLTHEQAATAIGRSRSATSNLLRLLNLAEPVQTMLLAGDIDMGHARALLAADAARQILLAQEVIVRRLSVRDTEKRVARALRDDDEVISTRAGRVAKSGPKPGNGDLERLEKALSDHLATRVRIKSGARQGGQLVIDFSDWVHLDALLERQGLSKVLEEQE